MRIQGLSVSLLLSILCLGCATVGSFSAPDVTLVNVKFDDLTLFETSGRLTVRVTNANNQPVIVDGGVYNLHLNGIKVGRALSDAHFEVPRLSSTTAEVEVFINNIAMATRIRRIIDTGVVDYRLKGKFFLDRSVGRRKVGFDGRGRYDFNETGSLDP